MEAWDLFFEFGGRPELAGDERFRTAADRINHADELYALMDDIVITKTVEEWMTFCTANSIPASPVADLEHLQSDEHFEAVGLFIDAQHPTEGSIRYVRDPIVVDGERSTLERHAPGLGEHTAEVLAELGWDQARIDALTDRGSAG